MTDTKNKLLQIGAKYVHLKGFNNTGLQEILKEAKVPKGSFYFYFKSKEEFGLEIIDVFLSFFEKELAKHGIDMDSDEDGIDEADLL